jgi:LmbE family N-acetylglucosaminyl deacetylase
MSACACGVQESTRNVMKNVNILAIGAHPDDIEFGCGGSLVKYSQRGHRLFLLVMTGGGSGAPSETRMAEQTAARDILGVAAKTPACRWTRG